ncbi:SDR family NAD(P)-dependent oxidoreductase [Streptomyces sp. NRRL S-1521]|uniref:SDR family NAD(P)-dependent oxidoreductase n=1 Tax=Streptomyces sp. NRRL S-1521 TaxID=1609100 RepID=UPI000746D95D|nr:SDR family oxidoreductase [Streptomyces sp. NRRL S-1521]KUL53156.1 short-chain dehydrogenase [Streptomyces sp. NRRL S-1521]
MTASAPFDLTGARVLVTGASRGIGRAIASAFAAAGAVVVVHARSAAALADTVGTIRGAGGRVEPVPGDLSVAGQADAVVVAATRFLGGLDVLVHNAAILPLGEGGEPLFTSFEATTAQQWSLVLDLDFGVSVTLCRAVRPHLSASSRASVVLVSSAAGLMAMPNVEAYAVAKAAQLSLVRSLSAGWASSGIRVNALCPGWTRTDMTAPISGNEQLSAALLTHVPLGRWAEPEEMGGAALFLASPAASFITGHCLVADGGLTVPDGGLTALASQPHTHPEPHTRTKE